MISDLIFPKTFTSSHSALELIMAAQEVTYMPNDHHTTYEVKINDIIEEDPESHHQYELHPNHHHNEYEYEHKQNQLYPIQEQQHTNDTDREIKHEIDQNNVVYIDCNDDNKRKRNKPREDEDILKEYCCVTITLIIGFVFTVISFLWIVDDTPYSDCAEFQDTNGCVDGPSRDWKDEKDNHLNDVAIGFLLFGIFMIIVGSFICYKKIKKDDKERDAAKAEANQNQGNEVNVR